MKLIIDFANKTSCPIRAPFFRKIMFDHLKNLQKKGNFQVSLSLVSSDEIRFLNKKYRQKDHVTDVLSFSTDVPQIKASPKYLGQIVIAYHQAKNQAEKTGHSTKKELKILTTHGLNHLLGKHHG